MGKPVTPLSKELHDYGVTSMMSSDIIGSQYHMSGHQYLQTVIKQHLKRFRFYHSACEAEGVI